MYHGFAIAQLEVALETVENNVPHWEAEGNHEQADLCRKSADDYRAAIQKLKEN